MKRPENNTYFAYDNPNPKGKKTSDCVIRAIAIAECKSWGEIFTALCEIAQRTGYMVNDRKCYEKYLTAQGYVKCKQPRKPDGKKYTGQEFCDYIFDLEQRGEITTPVVIAHIGSHHITAFVHDDVMQVRCHDTWNPTLYCVGNYWFKDC